VRVVMGWILIMGVVTIGAQQAPVYPVSDAKADVARALGAARRDGRHVLLDFGADWCPDCRVLDVVFRDPAVARLLERSFHVVRIDVGRRDRNGDLVAQYGATSGEWIPALVALDSAGAVIGTTTADIRVSRKTTSQELIALLERWAPQSRIDELGVREQHGVNVRLTLERWTSGRTWIAARFRPLSSGVKLYGATLPARGIDGLGRPTRIELRPSAHWRVAGPLVADRAERPYRLDPLPTVLPVYPPGPVTLRVPVRLTSAQGRGEVLVSYMACSDSGCLPPVIAQPMTVSWTP
jgi:thiol-disulfide isomerase/thioredoxin